MRGSRFGNFYAVTMVLCWVAGVIWLLADRSGARALGDSHPGAVLLTIGAFMLFAAIPFVIVRRLLRAAGRAFGAGQREGMEGKR